MSEQTTIKVMTGEVEMVPLYSITPYAENIKSHTHPQVLKVATSIAKFGWDQPIVVDKDNVIIKGHGRWLAAREMGLEQVPIYRNLEISPEDARAARIADNKVAESDYDTDMLWKEIQDLEGKFDAKDLGFDNKQLRNMFPNQDGINLKAPKPDRPVQEPDQDGCYDPTLPREEGFIGAFLGEKAYLRKMSMVDYLNCHDKILVGFSSGKDSEAALLWCLENCNPEKVVAYYGNPGWGVDWPHSIAYISYMEKMINKIYGIDFKIYRTGFNDVAGFESLLIQRGYLGAGQCYVQSQLKIPAINGLLDSKGWNPRVGGRCVQIIAIRWAESPDRAKIYPDRGYLKDTGAHYASPVISWTDGDVAKFLDERGIKLHTAYEGEARMGCLACSQGTAEGYITVRKKFPDHFTQIMKWYAYGARRHGRLAMESFVKWLSRTGDANVDTSRLRGKFSAMAMSTSEMEKTLVELGAITDDDIPYLNAPFDASKHIYQADLDYLKFKKEKAKKVLIRQGLARAEFEPEAPGDESLDEEVEA